MPDDKSRRVLLWLQSLQLCVVIGIFDFLRPSCIHKKNSECILENLCCLIQQTYLSAYIYRVCQSPMLINTRKYIKHPRRGTINSATKQTPGIRYIKHVVFMWKRESAAFSMAILVEIFYISQKKKNAHYSRNVSGKILSPLYRCHIEIKRFELNLFCRAHIRSYSFRLKPIMEKIYTCSQIEMPLRVNVNVSKI